MSEKELLEIDSLLNLLKLSASELEGQADNYEVKRFLGDVKNITSIAQNKINEIRKNDN